MALIYDFDTKENTTVPYDTIEGENRFNCDRYNLRREDKISNKIFSEVVKNFFLPWITRLAIFC